MEKNVRSRRILLVGIGTTPHLTTATLAAIYKTYPKEMPTEIHVVTTSRGAACVRAAYLSPEKSLLADFYRDYGLEPAEFDESHIHVLTTGEGDELDDIRTPEESAGAADFIMSLVRDFCKDPASSLHVSIVGGRKSMGLLLGSAMTFFARDDDRISHVLSRDEGPTAKPYPSPEELNDPGVISLGEIPFLRLRPVLPEALLNERYTYLEVVQASQNSLTARHTIKVEKKKTKWKVTAEGVVFKAERRALGLYLWLLVRRKLGRRTVTSYGAASLEDLFFLRLQFVYFLEGFQGADASKAYLGLSLDRLKTVMQALRNQGIREPAAFYRAFRERLTKEELDAVNEAALQYPSRISSSRSRFNDALEEIFDGAVPDVTKRSMGVYLIHSNKLKDDCSYTVNLSPEDIEIAPEMLTFFEPTGTGAAEYWKRI